MTKTEIKARAKALRDRKEGLEAALTAAPAALILPRSWGSSWGCEWTAGASYAGGRRSGDRP